MNLISNWFLISTGPNYTMKSNWFLTALLPLLTICAQMSLAGENPPQSKESFHVYLLLGQSNMAGRGDLESASPPPPSQILKLDQYLEWQPATEPLHFDNPKIAGAGLGLSFAEALSGLNPDITIGLIPCAVGGTSLSQWQKGGQLYQQALHRARKGIERGTLKGILWHQGEQDALNQNLSETYGERLSQLVKDLRTDLNAPQLPFVAGELGPFLSDAFQGRPTSPDIVNAQLHSAANSIPNFAVVSADDLTAAKDNIHFDTPSLRKLGKRYAAALGQLQQPAALKIATFNVDATPPLGSPVAYAAARKIEDRLSARGVILIGAGEPIVMCAVDWIAIGNSGLDIFREKLADAAGTSPDRVTVHALHQHDAPLCDFRAEEILEGYQLGGKRIDSAFCRHVIENASEATRKAIPQAIPVTHLGVGKALVEKVASNRRILGEDGKVKLVRFSASKIPAAQQAPEGVIDPELKLISFWNEETPLVSLTYYATHPQSYYGQGDVTSEFVGLARAEREQSLPNVVHIHFNGASGNVAAGKYNDGSREMRAVLTARMEEGMRKAWESTVRVPITSKDVSWRARTVNLPVSPRLTRDMLEKVLKEQHRTLTPFAAMKLAWIERDSGQGVPTDISCLNIGDVSIVHLPGELFVEYQLAAQKMRPDKTVCVAAYGDCGPLYIGTEISYSQGGYETAPLISAVAPSVEPILLDAIQEMLK